MSLTRKHFQSIADAVCRAEARMADVTGNPSLASMCTYEVADSLAREMKRHNPAFDRTRFMRACGIEYDRKG